MSWGILAEGTKAEASAQASKQLDQVAASYSAVGNPELQDILACKARILALIAVMQMDEGKKIRVEANGSHSWSGDQNRPVSANFTVKISVP